MNKNNNETVVTYHRRFKKTMKSSSRRLKLLLFPSIALLMLLLVGIGVNAGIQCNLTSVTTINQNTVLNATFNTSIDGTTNNVTVLFELRDTTLHVNSSYSVIGNVTNTTGQRWTNITFANSIIFADADNADLRATCYSNSSSALIDVATSSAVSSIVVDRSSPVTQGLSSPRTQASTNLYTVTFGVVNASRWRLFHNSVVAQTTTINSDIVNSTQQTFQISLRDSGNYYVETWDGTNTTNSQTISYTLAGGIIKSAVAKEAEKVRTTVVREKIKQQKSSGKGLLLIGALIIIIVAVGGMMLSPKVKKKRR